MTGFSDKVKKEINVLVLPPSYSQNVVSRFGREYLRAAGSALNYSISFPSLLSTGYALRCFCTVQQDSCLSAVANPEKS